MIKQIYYKKSLKHNELHVVLDLSFLYALFFTPYFFAQAFQEPYPK